MPARQQIARDDDHGDARPRPGPSAGGPVLPQVSELTAAAHESRLTAAELRAAALRVAEQVAAAEDAAAATFARMAEQRARDAERLRAKSQAAAERAASERRWIKEHGG